MNSNLPPQGDKFKWGFDKKIVMVAGWGG